MSVSILDLIKITLSVIILIIGKAYNFFIGGSSFPQVPSLLLHLYDSISAE